MNDEQKPRNPKNHHLALHNFSVLLIYTFATFLVYKIILIPDAHKGVVTTLSTGAIIATFGSAIATVGLIWSGDYANRILLNVDILYTDILKQDAWRRWPFLLRAGVRKLFAGEKQEFELQNPSIRLDVGSHLISVTVPTVQEDFFDLPLFKNLWPLFRFKKFARTSIFRQPKDVPAEHNHLKPLREYMAYECLLDVWSSVLIFRTARYVIHFGAALTISSAALTAGAVAGNVI